MFRLQRLEITGFKSFADHTQLVFTGDGITAVVGPNGCGKSNVADAISWVLGEQRAKQLRGSEMKDVIFQGSRNRQPSGMAEVMLTLARDETVFGNIDADIDDIDASLEDIDEHAENFNAEQENLGSLVAPDEKLIAETNDASATSEASSVIVLNNEATISPAVVETSANTEADLKKRAAHSKRHWRPRRLALEFAPGETVTVTRRLYRSGESEYLLNGRICRLRDIQDLFSGTGLAGAHYAIIEQGRIGQILSAKPMDRRTLIEEAAGITKFRVRQRAAEARLEAARANLRRVSDIVSEIERLVGSLRRQAAKARRYEQLRAELRELLRQVFVADERALNLTLEELQGALTKAAERERELAEQLTTREEAARDATTEARLCEEELATVRAAVAGAALQRDRRERERAYQIEQLSTLEKRIAQTNEEIKLVGERRAQVEEESANLREREAQLKIESDESATRLEAAEKTYAQRISDVRAAETEIEIARAELLTHTAATERLSEIGRQLENALERLGQQAEGLEREGERAHAAFENATHEADILQAEIATAQQHLNELIDERAELIVAVNAARESVSQADADNVRVRDETARVRHRLDTLAELDAQRSLYSVAVQRLLAKDFDATNDAHALATNDVTPNEHAANGHARRDFAFIGTLADALRVEPEWERAVESVLGAYLQTVIVPTPDDALRAAEWLQANEVGRATFLVAGLSGASGETAGSKKEESGVWSPESVLTPDSGLQTPDSRLFDLRVADLLGASHEIVAVLERALPRELNARVVENLEQALAMSLETRAMFVTQAGEWVAGGGLIGAGDVKTKTNDGAGLLAFKREMRELEARAVELYTAQIKTEEAARTARAHLSEVEDALVFLNENFGRAQRDQDARELRGQQLAQEIERTERHLRVVEADTARVAEEQNELRERYAKQQRDLATAEAARQTTANQVAQANELLAIARLAAESESEQLSAERASAATAAERRRATTTEMRRMEQEISDLKSRAERRASELVEIETQIAGLKNSLTQLESGESDFESANAKLEAAVGAAQARVADAREQADAAAKEVTELNRRAAQAREERGTLEVQKAQSEARLNYLREACVSELNQPLDELANLIEITEEFKLEESRGRVDELRSRLENFGAVNMMALEELAENEERLQFLTTQRQDITDGIISTEEALREIKRRSRDRFRQAFETINKNFGEFFIELFGGGRGEMSLLDAEDVLESGIDIVAQPPGKRLQNVLLLSGGEKAMAALALVLAIFRFHPSPFCLLDEVDAPLDEANIGRFTNKIVEMSERTQFIVITHNKKTMEVARALYGVTMEEAGVSKLVSVKFE